MVVITFAIASWTMSDFENVMCKMSFINASCLLLSPTKDKKGLRSKYPTARAKAKESSDIHNNTSPILFSAKNEWINK